MSMTGVCQICEASTATHTCESCGNLVCDEHFDESAGVCIQCAPAGGGRQF